MTYFPTDDQRMMLDTARAFTQRHVEPIANAIDHDETTPPDVTSRAAELGLFGLCIPERYGGVDAGLTTSCMVIEEIAKASPSLAGLLSVQIILCPITVGVQGSDAQKQRILPRLASGERLLAYSTTEPAGALNRAAHQTKLVKEGNHWRLNGAKIFCTQGEAKTYLVFCRTFGDGREGYGAAIVEQEADGFQVEPYEDKFGWRGTNTGGINFTDMIVTPDNILGDPFTGGEDHAAANHASFLGHAASSLGAAQGMFDKTLRFARERSLYGTQLALLSPVATWLADVYAKIEAMRAMLYTATRLYDEGRSEFPVHGSLCKTFICETAFQCTNTLLQIWGGTGMMNRAGINRYMRDARLNMVAEGATEMHHAWVLQYLLGHRVADATGA